MGDKDKIYVRMIEGASCLIPVKAQRRPDGTYFLGENQEFDPEDTSTLLEFLPGDVVRVERRPSTDGTPAIVIATQLVASQIPDRDYWAVLFALADNPGEVPMLDPARLDEIAARIRAEAERGERWHYPGALEIARKRGANTQNA